MIDMTKQYIYDGKPVRAYADGSDCSLGMPHGAILCDDGRWKNKAFLESELVEVWEPKEGEIVWFWDNCTPYRPTARKFGRKSIDDNGDLYFEDSEQNPFTDCAKFTGTLPETFKELV